jgi:hypothetical protein
MTIIKAMLVSRDVLPPALKLKTITPKSIIRLAKTPSNGTRMCLINVALGRLQKAIKAIRFVNPYTRNVPVLEANVICVKWSTFIAP